MTIVISNSGKPLYLRIKDALLQKILNGDWKQGDALPSRRAMAEELSTTQSTLDKAVSELIREGWLHASVGSGTYVKRNGPSVSAGTEAGPKPPARLSKVAVVFGTYTYMAGDADLAEESYYFGGILRGISDALIGTDISVSYLNAFHGEYGELMARDVDGMLILAPQMQDLLTLKRLTSSKPFVVIGSSSAPLTEGAAVPTIDADNEQGAFDALRHLIEQGHRSIGMICLGTQNSNYHDRLQGYLRAHDDAGLPISPRNLLLYPVSDDNTSEKLIEQWVANRRSATDMPTAVVACDFGTTLLATKVLKRHGLAIPDDISLISCDDHALFEHLTPSITAIRQPLFQMGRRAAERLLARFQDDVDIAGDASGERLPTRLLLRESVLKI